MRLWHQSLIPFLPRAQLLGQHRECCALRGKGWGKKHATVDYVFEHSYEMLFQYHQKIMEEMHRRGYKTEPLWHCLEYRGKIAEPYVREKGSDSMKLESNEARVKCSKEHEKEKKVSQMNTSCWIYPEHDLIYLQECLRNLERKGIRI